jgi:hypothetical protein
VDADRAGFADDAEYVGSIVSIPRVECATLVDLRATVAVEMRTFFMALPGLAMQIATPAQPPALLQIVREPLKPGSETAFSAIEQERARISATLGCPHPYLGAESLTGSNEAWWFNGYRSSTEQKQVYDAYARNAALMAALQQSAKPKADLTFEPIEVVARYRADLSAGTPWLLGHGRYLVITVTKSTARRTGTVFESPDGTRFLVTPTETRTEADRAKTSAGPEAAILAVRPSWSFPAPEWIAADPPFWRPSSLPRVLDQ